MPRRWATGKKKGGPVMPEPMTQDQLTRFFGRLESGQEFRVWYWDCSARKSDYLTTIVEVARGGGAEIVTSGLVIKFIRGCWRIYWRTVKKRPLGNIFRARKSK